LQQQVDDALERHRRRLDSLEAIVAGLPYMQEATPQAQQPAAVARPAPIKVTIHGQVGQLNLAELIERADARIEQVDKRGEGDLADGLRQLAEAIKAAVDAAEDQREDALDAVAVLAEVGSKPVEERGQMRGRIRGALIVIKELADVAPAVKQAWDAWGPVITEHLPRINS
jgi:hypothetical protein